jgi:hypothetical protein
MVIVIILSVVMLSFIMVIVIMVIVIMVSVVMVVVIMVIVIMLIVIMVIIIMVIVVMVIVIMVIVIMVIVILVIVIKLNVIMQSVILYDRPWKQLILYAAYSQNVFLHTLRMAKKSRVFFPEKLFQPSLMFVSKAGAYLSGAFEPWPSLQHYYSLERPAKEKHSSLFGHL